MSELPFISPLFLIMLKRVVCSRIRDKKFGIKREDIYVCLVTTTGKRTEMEIKMRQTQRHNISMQSFYTTRQMLSLHQLKQEKSVMKHKKERKHYNKEGNNNHGQNKKKNCHHHYTTSSKKSRTESVLFWCWRRRLWVTEDKTEDETENERQEEQRRQTKEVDFLLSFASLSSYVVVSSSWLHLSLSPTRETFTLSSSLSSEKRTVKDAESRYHFWWFPFYVFMNLFLGLRRYKRPSSQQENKTANFASKFCWKAKLRSMQKEESISFSLSLSL